MALLQMIIRIFTEWLVNGKKLATELLAPVYTTKKMTIEYSNVNNIEKQFVMCWQAYQAESNYLRKKQSNRILTTNLEAVVPDNS